MTWTDRSHNEDGFKIERSIDGGNSWSQITTVSANVTSYHDVAAPESATTQYRVRAYTGSANSAYSVTASDTTPLAAPTALTATTPASKPATKSSAAATTAHTGPT